MNITCSSGHMAGSQENRQLVQVIALKDYAGFDLRLCPLTTLTGFSCKKMDALYFAETAKLGVVTR